MSVEIVECIQGTPEWHKARAGRPTASEFSTVLAGGRGGGESKTRGKYMRRLAGEILTGEPEEGYENGAMARGRAMEPEARDLYSLTTNATLTQVGFLVNGRVGASPDSLIGDKGALEVKTQIPSLLIERLLSGDVPTEHIAQLQGILWVAEREWIDIAIYWPKLPLFRRRVKRDEQYIARLKIGVSAFLEELDELVEKLRNFGNG
jgi:hypothetical protein